MSRIIRVTLILSLLITLNGCGESFDSAYDRGLDDGYAAGYNTTCNIRATLISGDWDVPGYQEGYNRGYAEGSRDCRSKND